MEHIKNAVSASYGAAEYLSLGVDVSRGGGVDLFSDPSSPIANQDGPPEMVKEVLGKRLGISRNNLVVIYSDGADSLDTRFWWTLERLGHKRMCILYGGLDKWLEDGYKTVKKATKAPPVEYGQHDPDRNCQVDTDWVLGHLSDPELKMVFLSKYGNYYGQETTCSREGHIPGSVCVPVAAHFSEDSTWKSPAELRRIYHNLGVTEDKIVIPYCLHGVAATTGYFALRHILGYPRVSLYLASKAGWCYDSRNLPLETYGNPRLLRDTQWVYYWMEQAHQRMNDTGVRVVDARPAAEYAQGHVPFALSFPAEDVSMSGDGILPAARKLRSMLGKIGISADTKIVIYDRGDALQAAWLFWVLEYLGHGDVGIMDGGFAKWQAEKRKATTEAAVIRKSRSGHVFDLTIPPATFRATTRYDRVATPDWVNRYVAYPDKTFLVAGTAASTAVPGAKHIPWSSNLAENGVFKTAAHLTKIYYKEAGIDPFKEIACCAQTPMPAAHAYFTLRLLGYPRVHLCCQA